MAIQLNEIVEVARYEHPLFEQLRKPVGPIIRRLNRLQREVFNEVVKYDKTFMAQRYGMLVTEATDARQPAGLDEDGELYYRMMEAGKLITVKLLARSTYGKSTTATSTVVTDSAQAWAVNEHIGRFLRWVTGDAKGQLREVGASTATTATISNSTNPFDPVPATGDAYEIWTVTKLPDQWQDKDRQVPVFEGGGIFVGRQPATSQEFYPVIVDTDGTAKIDTTTQPATKISVLGRVGVPMPPAVRICGMDVYRQGSTLYMREGSIVPYALRNQPPSRPAMYLMNDELYLVDPTTDWRPEDQIDIRFVPVPPDLVKKTNYFLLPETARPMLEYAAMGALELRRETGLMERWDGLFAEAKAEFYQTVGAKRPSTGKVKETW